MFGDSAPLNKSPLLSNFKSNFLMPFQEGGFNVEAGFSKPPDGCANQFSDKVPD